jgi:hypothetical protein
MLFLGLLHPKRKVFLCFKEHIPLEKAINLLIYSSPQPDLPISIVLFKPKTT